MWNDGLIYGFCGKDEAERLLNDCTHSTLLIRFSDIEFGKIKVSVRDRTGIIRHHWYDQNDLQVRPLNRELLSNSKYAGVSYVVFCSTLPPLGRVYLSQLQFGPVSGWT